MGEINLENKIVAAPIEEGGSSHESYIDATDASDVFDAIKNVSEDDTIHLVAKAQQIYVLVQRLKDEQEKWQYAKEWQAVYDEIREKAGYMSDQKMVEEMGKMFDLIEEKEKTEGNVLGEKELVLESLAGIDTPAAWAIRDKMMSRPMMRFSIAGLDNKNAWALRDKWMEDGEHARALISLAGVDNQRAWDMRSAKIPESDEAWKCYIDSIVGLDSINAWNTRNGLLKLSTGYNRRILGGLAGLDSEQAWTMRERLSSIVDCDGDLARSIIGLDSERAWVIRDTMVANKVKIEHILESISGLDSEKAWELRDEFIKDSDNIQNVASSLAGLNSERAWLMRQAILDAKPLFVECTLAASMNGRFLASIVRQLMLKRKCAEEMRKREEENK